MFWLWVSVGGLLLLLFLAPFDKAADDRRVAEQQQGDAEQLTRNLGGCLVGSAVVLAIATALVAIGYGWTP